MYLLTIAKLANFKGDQIAHPILPKRIVVKKDILSSRVTKSLTQG
jgi:hypothetical protein